jgi:hypothetical protein
LDFLELVSDVSQRRDSLTPEEKEGEVRKVDDYIQELKDRLGSEGQKVSVIGFLYYAFGVCGRRPTLDRSRTGSGGA